MSRIHDIESNLAALRQKRGLSAAELAKMAGVTRQTIYAMEAASYVPNTAVALKLARALEARVEDLFTLTGDPAPAVIRHASVLPGSEGTEPGQPVQLCRVDNRVYASPPSPVAWFFPASDGVIAGHPSGGKAGVQVFRHDEDTGARLLVAGCDPGISVLARHVQAAGVELVLAHRNSSRALELLKAGCVHIAGTHLWDEGSGESNLPQIGRMFKKGSVAVISFAVWEEGMVTARGNPKGIRGVEDLARRDVVIVNREAGAGSRKLLDAELERLGISARRVRGYDRTAPGHLPAAWQVLSGEADCAIATRAAARLFGLGFLPLVSERYDLVIRRAHLAMPAVQAVLDTLSRAGFRRELEGLGGYDARVCGEQRV